MVLTRVLHNVMSSRLGDLLVNLHDADLADCSCSRDQPQLTKMEQIFIGEMPSMCRFLVWV